MRNFFLAAALTVCGFGTANAATILESSFGDFGGVVPAVTDIGSLDGGTNTITGSLAVVSCPTGGCIPVDDIADVVLFTVPTGFELVGVSLETIGTERLNYITVLFDSVLTPLGIDTFAFGSGGLVSGAVSPAGSYLFGLEVQEPGGLVVPGAPRFPDLNLDYVATIELRALPDMAPVPLPAGAPLLLVGLAVLGLATRRGAKA